MRVPAQVVHGTRAAEEDLDAHDPAWIEARDLGGRGRGGESAAAAVMLPTAFTLR